MEELNSGSRDLVVTGFNPVRFSIARMIKWESSSPLFTERLLELEGPKSIETQTIHVFPADIDGINSQRAPWNDSQEQFLQHLLQCFSRAWTGVWSEDAWKIVAQAMNKNFPNSNFTIQQLMQHGQYLIGRLRPQSSGGLSGSLTKIIPCYAAPVTLHKGRHREAELETKSATTQIGVWADAGHNAQCITNRLCSRLSPPKEEGSMNNLNSSSTVPQSVMSGNLQVRPVNFHSFNPSSAIIPPCGDTCGSNCENKISSNNDSNIGRNHRLSAPLSQDPASNSQQLDKHDRFYRKKHIRKVRGKRNCKKLRAAKSDFSVTRCIKMFKKLPGFKEYQIDHVLEIFSDELYREAFISMKTSHKVFWLRSKLDKKE